MGVMYHNNGDICYEVHGGNLEDPKSTYVLIHGFGFDKEQWKLQTDQLVKEGNRVITYDLRGFGESSVPVLGEKYSHADDLEALLKTLGVEGATIVGHSFGGAVAIDFAAKKPGMAEGLVLMASSLGSFGVDPQSPMARWSQMAREGKIDEVEAEMLAHESLTSLKPEQFALASQMLTSYLKRPGLEAWHFRNADPDRSTLGVAEELPKIECPVQIIIGEKDSKSSRDIADEIKRLLTEGKEGKKVEVDFQLVEGAGHFLNLEDPEGITRMIETFTETHRKIKEDTETEREIKAHSPGVEGGYSIG
jgi:3-oxoadipate enol-lactonase